MVVARYKDLCIDVVDEARMTAFWASALGLTPWHRSGKPSGLRGPTPQHGVWLNPVPEPVTVKQRVHLDLHTASVDELVALGAAVLPGWGPFPWTVMVDPEGGELCAFVRDEPPAYRLYELGIDSAAPERIARWWAHVLGGSVEVEDDVAALEGVPGQPFDVTFVRVEEPKTVKNRVHWDIEIDSEARDGGVQALVDLGARVLREHDDEIDWDVLADPEGNEFCLFTHLVE